jgi:hypothetical protein
MDIDWNFKASGIAEILIISYELLNLNKNQVMKKTFFLLAFVVMSMSTVFSQDTIFRSNGTKIICKITGQDNSFVNYKILNNGRINTLSVSRSEITAVKYGSSNYLDISVIDRTSIGIGYGQPFGFIGGNLLIYPQRNIGLFAGVGYDLIGMGYNLGAKIRFVKAESTSNLHFFLTGMYGYVAVIKVQNADLYNKTFNGPTFGFGLDVNSSSNRGFWTMSLLIPVRGTAVQDYIDKLKNNYGVIFKTALPPVTISLGYMFILN